MIAAAAALDITIAPWVLGGGFMGAFMAWAFFRITKTQRQLEETQDRLIKTEGMIFEAEVRQRELALRSTYAVPVSKIVPPASTPLTPDELAFLHQLAADKQERIEDLLDE